MKKTNEFKINDGKEIKDYRNFLVAADQRAQQDFDKTLLALSCGAIGISFAFTKEIASLASVIDLVWLTWSWRFWACSLLATLASHYFSHMSLLKTIKQVDQGLVYIEKPGGFWAHLTDWTNLFGGLFFVVGVLTFIHFVSTSIKK